MSMETKMANVESKMAIMERNMKGGGGGGGVTDIKNRFGRKTRSSE
jgi:hypothetical protein